MLSLTCFINICFVILLGGIPRGRELLAGEVLEAPLVFRGKSDTLGSEGWIKKLVYIFETILDVRESTLVSFVLEDEAEFWWGMIARTTDVCIDALLELDPSTSNMVV